MVYLASSKKIRRSVAAKDKLTFAAFLLNEAAIVIRPHLSRALNLGLGGQSSISKEWRTAIKKVRTSLKGRKCRFPHCKQVLSIYNHEEFCHIHMAESGQKEKVKRV